MKVYIDNAAPGSGKTYRQIRKLIAFPGRTIFATERVETIADTAREIQQLADEAGVRAKVVAITGTTSRSTSVRVKIEGLAKQYAKAAHVIVIVSHAGLMLSDLRDFHGWNLVIDETPPVLTMDEKCTFRDHDFFRRHYTLERWSGNQNWSTVHPTEEGRSLAARDLAQDQSHEHLRCFHQRVLDSANSTTREVVCNLSSWDDMTATEGFEAGGAVARPWMWGSLTAIANFDAFSHITILANRFDRSVAFKLLDEAARRDGDPIEWIDISTTRAIEWTPRRVTVNYYSERRASFALFDSEEGRANLVTLSQHLAEVLSPDCIWSANRSNLASLSSMPADRFVRPRQAGTNEFAAISEAAMIYTAKASNQVAALLKVHGVDHEDWTKSNEYEVILQFMTRTSLRNPASDAPVTLHVYGRDQADYLSGYLSGLSHVDLTVQHVEIGLNDVVRPRGRPRVELTPDELAARAQRKRENHTLYMQKTRAAKKAAAGK